MKKILAFAGSNHSKSIHYQLLESVAPLAQGATVEILDIRNWNIPIYSIDMDPDETPDLIQKLIEQIESYDGFIIASPEHNGGTPAFFKNILDWLSRRAKKVFNGKPVLLLSTSPGAKGGANHLQFLGHTLPYQGAKVVAQFSLPSYYDNLKDGKIEATALETLKKALQQLEQALR